MTCLNRSLALIAASACAASLSACATTSAKPTAVSAVGGAIQQPFRDLNVIRETTPEPLTAASKAVYGKSETLACDDIRSEIALLDESLGPDLDANVEYSRKDQVTGFASEALKGAIDVPFRGVVRFVSGAAVRDMTHQRAVMAGMVRRGYLKGLLRSQCDAPAAALAATPAAASEAVEPPPLIEPAAEPPPQIDLKPERHADAAEGAG